MGGEGTAGLLSLLIREGELDRGEVGRGGSAHILGGAEGQEEFRERLEIHGWGQKPIEGRCQTNLGTGSNKFRDGVRDTGRNGTERWGDEIQPQGWGRESGGQGKGSWKDISIKAGTA